MNRKRPLDEHILTGTAWLTHRRPDLAGLPFLPAVIAANKAAGA